MALAKIILVLNYIMNYFMTLNYIHDIYDIKYILNYIKKKDSVAWRFNRESIKKSRRILEQMIDKDIIPREISRTGDRCYN